MLLPYRFETYERAVKSAARRTALSSRKRHLQRGHYNLFTVVACDRDGEPVADLILLGIPTPTLGCYRLLSTVTWR